MCALLSLFAVALAVSLLAVDSSAQDKGDKKGRDPAEMIKQRDKDGDGKLSLAEFTAGMEGERLTRAEGFFKRIDKDTDGFVTLEELKARPQKGKKKGDN